MAIETGGLTLNEAPTETSNGIPPPKPFPYWPSLVPIEEMKRMAVMQELNMWANNDPFMAKRAAETLIMLLANQFDINLLKINE